MGEIFISYARADDEPFVKQLYQDLKERGFDIWWDREKMESRGLTFLQEIREAIEGSDRLIAVIGPNAVKSEYVKVEWEHALLFSKGVVPILRGGLLSQDIIDYNLVPPELSKFHCPDFRKERTYQDALAELVRVLTEPVSLLGAFRTAVPSLPPHFLPRRDELDLLGNVVLADIKRPEVVNSARQQTVIVGMGGMGKSVLAAAFARSTETRRAFTDGIAWISIGQNPDMLSNLRQLGFAFNDKMENYVDLKTARDKLPGVLADKVCLIVLDDIWNVARAEPIINALGPRCRLLITTRDGGIASALEANEHRLGVLTDAAALRFLANWCGKDVGSLPPEAVSVVKECGNLPFALALCGAMARDGTAWPDMLDALKEADLTFIEKKFPNYPYTDVMKCLKISVDTLANEYPEAVKHYQKLVIYHSHKKIPEAAIMTLWMHTDGLKERNARKLLTTLNSKALLTLEGESPHRFATLHDLQHDYLRAIEGDQKKLHEELLEAYQKKCKDGWQGGPNDGYFFENLAYHLVEAGRKDEMRKILFDFGWIHAKFEANDVNSLLRDYDFLSNDRNLRLVQSALRLSAHVLALNKTHLRGQFYGRLMGQEALEIKILLDHIRKWKDKPWLRPLVTNLMQPGGPLIGTLEGHENSVWAIAVFQDGKRAISASSDNTLKIWDIENGEVLKNLEGHNSRINAVALFKDGKRAISASSDSTLKVWDMESGNLLKTLEGHTDWVNAVELFQDGKRAISVSSDNTLKIWDIENGEVLKTLDGHTHYIYTVAVFQDGKRAITGSSDNTLKVWDIENGKVLKTLEGHDSRINTVAILKDGKQAISGSSDNTLKVWDMETGKVLKTLEGHNSRVNTVAVFQDNKRAISGSSDNTLKVWDIEGGNVLKTLEGHTGSVNSVAVYQEGKRMISASSDNTLKAWDMESKDMLKTLKEHTQNVNGLAVFQDGKRAISASDDNTLKIWDTENAEVLKTLKGHTFPVTAIAVFQDDKRAISASWDNTLKVWDIETGKVLKTLEGHTFPVTATAVFQDGKRAISASFDNMLKVWDLKSGEVLKSFRGHTHYVNSVAVFRDGKHAISASSDKTLKVWDLDSGEVLKSFRGHTHYVNSVAVFQDGKHAISASDDGTIKVWDMDSGEAMKTLKGHTHNVNALTLFQDGKHAISASDDKTIKVWEIESGKVFVDFVGDAPFSSCAVSPDGKIIIAGEASGKVYFLRLEGAS